MEQITPKLKQTQDDRCRICLEYPEYLMGLENAITVGEQTLSYQGILNLVCKLETKTSVNTPNHICKICAENAEVAYKFKHLCEKSDKILESELTSKSSDGNQQIGNLEIECIEDEDYSQLESISSESTLDFTDQNLNESNAFSDSEVILPKQSNDSTFQLNPKTVSNKEPSFSEIGQDLNILETSTNTKDNDILVTNSANINTQAFRLILEPSSGSTNAKHILEPTCASINMKDGGCKLEALSASTNLKEVTEYDPASRYICNCGPEKKKAKLNIRTKTSCNCNYSSSLIVDDASHQKVHKDKKCEFCEYSYTLNDSYQKHLAELHLDRKIGCAFCKQVYFNPQSLINHMKREHLDEKDFPDDHQSPDFLVNALAYLGKDIEEDTGVYSNERGKLRTACDLAKKGAQCTNCDERFVKKQDLVKHLETHCQSHEKTQHIQSHAQPIHDDDKQDILTNLKIEDDQSLEKLDIQDGQSHGKQDIPMHLEMQDDQKHDTLTHLETQHSQSAFYRKECGEQIDPLKSFRSHGNGQFKCQICSKSFNYRKHLNQHMKDHKKKQYKSDACEKDLALERTEEKRHVCVACGKCFVRTEILKMHMKLHISC